MDNKEVMIKVDHVSKVYRLGQINRTTLQHEIQSWWAKKRGKEDPNRKIGTRIRKDEFLALDDVSLTIYKGETVGIIGRNGAGKSTLLKLLSRVTAPTEGRIDLYGRITSMLEVGTGFNKELTGRENIYVNGAILGMKKNEVDAKMEDIIDFSELREFIDTPVKRFSSGMYTKLGFSVAVNLDSEIVIMDEVLAVGDVSFQNKCIAEMKKAAQSDGRTVLYVSHNMSQIRQLCQRCIVLEKGHVVFDGDTEKAIEYYLKNSIVEDTKINYENYVRTKVKVDHGIQFKSACYPGKDSIVFNDEEPLKLQMKITSKKDLPTVGLRIVVRSITDQRLGAYIIYDLCKIHKDKTTVVDLEVDITPFRDNTYSTFYTLFSSDDNGTYYVLDRVDGLDFTKVSTHKSKELVWNFEVSGSLLLTGAKVKKTRTEK